MSFFCILEQKKEHGVRALSCGGWDRTTDLQVMSLTSYHCSTPRHKFWRSFQNRLQKYCFFLKYQNLFAFF